MGIPRNDRLTVEQWDARASAVSADLGRARRHQPPNPADVDALLKYLDRIEAKTVLAEKREPLKETA